MNITSIKYFYFLITFAISSFSYENIFSFSLSDSIKSKSRTELEGTFFTHEYHNLFKDLIGKSDLEINDKINAAFQQLFYGSDDTQRIYYPVENDMAYIEDINNNDVRTEGMSYGMMIAVQLDKKEVFDRIWKWAKTYMQHKSGQRKAYFAWHCKTNGNIIDSCTASDGEEWFVTDLFFASARWGSGKGIFNYKEEAQKILDAMIGKTDSSVDKNVVTNVFNKKVKQIVFVPAGDVDDFTDPSYHLPHFYDIWAKCADKENIFWSEVADTSRIFLMRVVNPVTGLAPDYAHFDGTPFNPWEGRNHDDFRFDAWRVAMNIAIDYLWFSKDEWEVKQSNILLNFFFSNGIKTYGRIFTLDGKCLSGEHSVGLVSANAVAAIASTNKNRKEFVEQLWDAEIPSGHYRYYDGVLYMLGLLEVTDNYRIYNCSQH